MKLFDQIVYIILWLFSFISLRWARVIGRCLAKLAMCLDYKHRKIIYNNLRSSFPERDEKWIKNTVKLCFLHLGQLIMEFPYLCRLEPRTILAYTRHYGLENLRAALAKGRGVLLLTSHLGNWEWSAVASGLVIGEACLVVRPLDSLLAERLAYYWRLKTGNNLISKTRSARNIITVLRRGGIVGVLLDQNVDWYDGEWVYFFGQLACTNKGLALLAIYTGASVLTYHSFRAVDGIFDIYFGSEIFVKYDGTKSEQLWENTQRFTYALEVIIRKKPEQWFWIHRRWKTKSYNRWPR